MIRVGVPDEMVTVIRQFHDGMLAQIHVDDGIFSEVTQGMRNDMCTVTTTIQRLLRSGTRSCSGAVQ